MEEPKKKYILLNDRVGCNLERNLWSLGLSMKAMPTLVIRGELLEALPKAEQPSDGNTIALITIEHKSLRLECPTADVTRLSDEEANLLLAISSLPERYATFIDRKRLDFGRRLSPESQVFVSVKGFTKELPGVVWYKGELPPCPGTMFGVELIKHKGQGTSDGTFRNKRYFTCPANSGVFVGLDKLTTRELSDSKSPKRDENAQGNFKSKLMDTVMPSFRKLKNEGKSPQEKINQALEIDQRVVTFIKDYPVRGTVRYIGREEDASGNMRTIVGLELDKRVGSGTGKWNRRQLFVCKVDFACFVDVENVIREEDFDANPLTAKKTPDKQDAIREQIQKDELLAKSMSYDKRTSGAESVKKVRRTNSFKSAEVILDAGESSQTDPTAFIEKQRQMLSEMKNPKSDKRDTFSDGDVDMHDKDRTSQIPVVIEDDHFMPYSSYRDDRPNTDQHGFSNRDLRSQGAARKGSYSDFVTIGKEDYEMSVQKHEVHRAGGPSEGKTHRTISFNSNDDNKNVVESNQTDATTFVEQQRQTWVSFGEEDQQEENSQTQLSDMEQRVKRMQEQLREKEDELEISERLREQQLTNFHEQQRHLHGQLREKDQQEENLQRQFREIQEDLREKDQQEENSQRQLREIQEQLREKDQQEEDLQRQLREIQEQLREKDQQEENSQRQLREIQEQLREKDQQEENSQRQLREIQEQLREKDQQEENLKRQLREIREQLREKDQQEKSAQRQVTGLERQLRIKDQQVNELQITLSTAQQALSEHQRRQVTPDWVISRDQIQLTDKLLGRGGWGSVVEGKYCGCSVAVKQIHELILSPHNRTLFEREMDVASRCRHPCLLQFVGATNEEGSPLFVTELMESSLRALLEQRPLAGTEVSTISLDVARALNYLHQKKPSPIIHRDISSANVLLWRQGDQWRGKVSDYGTANFMQHTMTVGPGATIYMAPEALTPNQTVKVDVYSFGILLCEMCIRELPDPERRNQQIAMVKEHLLRALIRGCLQSDPEARPNMEEIIEELEEPV